MPITATFDPVTERLTSCATGMLSYDDARVHSETSRAQLAGGHTHLFDARGAFTNLTSAQVRQLTDCAKSSSGFGRAYATAIVTTNDVLFGMARMFEMLSDGHMGLVSVFREIGSARAWLKAVEAAHSRRAALAVAVA